MECVVLVGVLHDTMLIAKVFAIGVWYCLDKAAVWTLTHILSYITRESNVIC